MKYIKLFVLFSLSFMLFGCFEKVETTTKESDEIKLCDLVETEVNKYEKGDLTIKELSDNLKVLYDDKCKESNMTTCVTIESLNRTVNANYEIKDCSTYTDEKFKDLCEKSNNVTKELIDKKSEVLDAYVSQLKRNCKIVRE